MARVNHFVENGGRMCRTLARSVSVDVDPNARKKNFPKFSVFFREVTPDSPSPRKPHINTGICSNTAPLSQMPVWGVFGVRRRSSQGADLRDQGRDGGTHWRRGDSGLNQARTRNVRVAQQGSTAFIEQRRPQEPAVMCGQEGRNAARASCTQRRHKKSRRRSSDRQRTGLAGTGRLRTG